MSNILQLVIGHFNTNQSVPSYLLYWSRRMAKTVYRAHVTEKKETHSQQRALNLDPYINTPAMHVQYSNKHYEAKAY